MAVGDRPIGVPAARSTAVGGLGRLGGWGLPLGLALALSVLSLVPYLYAFNFPPHDRVFMGFFFLGDDANTYLAKMRQGWEGNWIWVNRYTAETGPGAYFFVFWILLGKLSALSHLPLLFTFHLSRVLGAFALLGWGWVFIKHFVVDPTARRFGIVLMGLGLGLGYVIGLLGHPVVFGQQTDILDLRMPELSAWYSILALPHFVWAAAFQAIACVLTLRAAERGSLRLGVLAGVAWLGESTIHAQMPLLLGAAVAIALLVRPVSLRGYLAAGLAFAIAGPYVAYSYYESLVSPEVLRWSAQWRNNLPPDGLSLSLALAPTLLLALLALPGAWRRRSRGDVFLVAWLLLLVFILWLPNPAGNLRRRFFDGVFLPLACLAALGMYEQVVPRLRTLRLKQLVPFAFVAVTTIGSVFLLVSPMVYASNPQYSITRGEYQGLQWLGGEPAGVVLSSAHMGLYVPAYSPDTVYVGQYSETYNYFDKARRAKRLLNGSEDAGSFASGAGMRYVFWSDEFGPTEPSGLGDPAFTAQGVKIWRLR